MYQNLDADHLKRWVGNTESAEETISAEPLQRMRAMLDRDPGEIKAGEPVPALWHWAYFLHPIRASELGRDGHAALGDFMPPVPLPRRMWAGGQFSFKKALKVGDYARRQSTVRDVNVKHGLSGRLCFVEVEHCIFVGRDLRFSEIHNIVYRGAKIPGEEDMQPPEAPQDAQWSHEVVPTSTLLFRYSALTFNAHRIHYDLDFCRNQEGYPGLVLHGPLTATLLLEFAMEENPGRQISSYEFRAISPLYADAPFTLNGRMQDGNARMWATNADGRLAMESLVWFSD
ncbi:MAG: acyl-CoA dehydrogenase [Gammaproteobacteria bacterium]|nr:acyl-CoA dehydrogenase [Gammaproteobacteria bacterium]